MVVGKSAVDDFMESGVDDYMGGIFVVYSMWWGYGCGVIFYVRYVVFVCVMWCMIIHSVLFVFIAGCDIFQSFLCVMYFFFRLSYYFL